MKKDKVSIVLTIFLIIATSLLLYPTVADYWNASRSTRIVKEYSEELASSSRRKIETILEEARVYNKKMEQRQFSTEMSDGETEEYYSALKLGSTDIMARVEIPSINMSLPIYHGTRDQILQSAVGHMEWTSLPVGGIGTHSVITAHRGLISARLFTDIDQLALGDLFYIYAVGEKLSYQVDQIKTVLPHERDDLLRDPEKDYMTLLTCTPYGINTHRLLVRGSRIENEEISLPLTSETPRIKTIYLAMIVMIGLGIFSSLILFYKNKRKSKERRIGKEDKH